jgi:predicted DCC family thiol-disulfide oxidoreductase YuxK
MNSVIAYLIYNKNCPVCSFIAEEVKDWFSRGIIDIIPNDHCVAPHMHEDLDEEKVRRDVHLVVLEKNGDYVLYSGGKAVFRIFSMKFKIMGWFFYPPFTSIFSLMYFILKKFIAYVFD